MKTKFHCGEIRNDNCMRSKQTNFERIKAMTVEEMAVVIMCPYLYSEPCGNDKNCNTCCKEWLESEVSEDD